MSKLEGPDVGGMPSGQRDELILVAESTELLIEVGNCLVVEVLLPVERRRAIVGQEFAGELRMNGLCEFLCFRQVRSRCLEPEDIGVGTIGKRSGNCRGDSVFD